LIFLGSADGRGPFVSSRAPRRLREVCRILQHVLFTLRYFEPREACPYRPLFDFGPTPATFLGLSLLKDRLVHLTGTGPEMLKARYKERYCNDRIEPVNRQGIDEPMPIRPDVKPGESQEDELRDYHLLSRSVAGRWEPFCAIDVEYNSTIPKDIQDACRKKNMLKGLVRRLIPTRSPFKVGIYRAGKCNGPGLRLDLDRFEQRCDEIRGKIERLMQEEADKMHGREDWMFLIYPYYDHPGKKKREYPLATCPEDTHVRVYTAITTPPERVEIRQAPFDFWDLDRDLKAYRWVRETLEGLVIPA
jgi:hypothetical protein